MQEDRGVSGDGIGEPHFVGPLIAQEPPILKRQAQHGHNIEIFYYILIVLWCLSLHACVLQYIPGNAIQ